MRETCHSMIDTELHIVSIITVLFDKMKNETYLRVFEKGHHMALKMVESEDMNCFSRT